MIILGHCSCCEWPLFHERELKGGLCVVCHPDTHWKLCKRCNV